MPETEAAAESWSEFEMSNFDHSVAPGLEEDLRAGMLGTHSAWNFNGQLRHDAEQSAFTEEVFVYHVSQGVRSAPTLEELMRVVNDEFGWD
jgi:hypothetical protein